jgi:hypothetical protein
MAGSLVLIQETTVSSGVSAVTLTGITSDFNVYKVIANNVQIDTDSQPVKKRFTVSGSAVTSSSYDFAFLRFRTENTFEEKFATNQDSFGNLDSIGTVDNEQLNETIYIFNATNSSEFTFATHEAVMTIHDSSHCHGIAGGVVLTETSVVDGITFFAGSGNIDAGNFKLYGLVK